MARRKTSLLEDLFVITAKIPWWFGVALAFASFILLSVLSSIVLPETSRENIESFVFLQFLATSAGILQYILPLLFLAAAVVSFSRSRKRRKLFNRISQSDSGDMITSMSWREFEHFVGEIFRRKGYSIEETGGQGADGGVDVILKKDGERFFVQCKQWRAYKVSINIVRELYGVMAAHGAAGGFVVTSGEFTADARDFAEGRNIELIDGNALAGFLEQPALKTTTAPTSPAPAEACPRCNRTMVRRTAKRGINAGKQFWGCPGFPDCRGIRVID